MADAYVRKLLSENNFEAYLPVFETESITKECLPLLTFQNSREIIPNFGDRLRLLKCIEANLTSSSECLDKVSHESSMEQSQEGTEIAPSTNLSQTDPTFSELVEVNIECLDDVSLFSKASPLQVNELNETDLEVFKNLSYAEGSLPMNCEELDQAQLETVLLNVDSLTENCEELNENNQQLVPHSSNFVLDPLSAKNEVTAEETSEKTSLQKSPKKNSLALSNKIVSYDPQLLSNRDWTKLKEPFLEFLKGSGDGESILLSFNKKPDNQDRKRLSEFVITHELSSSTTKIITSQRFKELSLSIVALFPSENHRTWYIPQINLGQRRKLNAGGKLYQTYLTKRRYYRKSGLLESNRRSKVQTCNVSQSPVSDNLNGKDFEEDLVYLKHTTGDNYHLLEEKWKKTSAVRLSQLHKNKNVLIHDYMKEYCPLLKGYASSLITIDFETLYPEKINNLALTWPGLIDKIYHFAVLKAKKDKAFRSFITTEIPQFYNIPALSKEEQLFYSFMILPSVISPGTRKGTAKFSRKEVKDDFILYIPKKQDLRVELQRRNERLSLLKIKSEPIPVLSGEDLKALDCYVEVNNTLYNLKSPLEAVDIAFKSIFVFDAAYSAPSEKVWIFLEKFIYKLTKSSSKAIKGKRGTSSDLECLAAELGLVTSLSISS